MKRQGAFALILALCFTVGGCGEKTDEQLPGRRGGEIVRVGSAVLTESDVENLLPEGEKVPFTTEEKKIFVERWINQEILYQKAVSLGLLDDPRVRARLRSLEQEFLADHIVFLELRDRTWVTEKEIEEDYERHKREYVYEYRVSHILVNTIESAEEVKELLATKSFTWVANHYSVDPAAKRGGDLGYLTKGNMITEFESVIFKMKPGEISDIVKSDFGYHIIKLIGMREAQVKVSLDDVREQIMNELVMEKREKAYMDFLSSLKTAADIEYIDETYAREITAAGGDTMSSGGQQ
jgi:peptidyl-prolyl cis-trans isomerase C